MGLLLLASPTLGQAAPETPTALVEAFHSDLLNIMKSAKSLGVSGRYNKFLGLIDEYFDLPLMVRFVTAKQWATADSQARHAVTAAARRMSAAELAVLFDDYGGEVFKTTGTRDIKDGTVLVQTVLKREGEDDVKVSYRALKIGGNWRIIDVMLDGDISQLVKRRGEYARTLADKGIAGLTKLLNDKAAEITAPQQAKK